MEKEYAKLDNKYFALHGGMPYKAHGVVDWEYELKMVKILCQIKLFCCNSNRLRRIVQMN